MLDATFRLSMLRNSVLAAAFFLAALAFTAPALASPGGPDASGGHTCRTNCAQYGLATGDYHCHRAPCTTSAAAAPAPPPAPPPASEPAPEPEPAPAAPPVVTTAVVLVLNVVDGDTVDVQLPDSTLERLRLIGMDTPETVDPRTQVQCYGREASARAHELLDGQAVTLELDPSQGERDRYGRLLAYLWLPDGANFAEVMIGEGYAHEYTYYLPYTYQASFQAAQEWAMVNGLGLWGPETCAGDTSQPADSPPPAAEVVPPPAEDADVPPAEPAGPVLRYDPAGPDRDCGDFSTHAEAQAFFEAAGGPGSDRHRLDADRDGIACESLP